MNQEELNELIRQFLGSNQGAAFYSVFPQAGGTNPYSDFLRGSQSRTYGSYLAELPKNPNLLYQDFLKGQDLGSQFKNLAPSQRGENPSRFAPPVRFLPSRY